MKWPNVQLRLIANVESGFGFPLDYQGEVDGEIPFYKVSDMNLSGNEVEMRCHNNSLDVNKLRELGARSFPPGTVIFPKIGAAIATEKKRILTCPSTFDNNVMGVIPREGVVSKYLFYWFSSINLKDLANPGHVPSIRKAVIEELLIPLPPLSEQCRIVEILDEADRIRRLRKDANQKAERILPALFLKMFGDPATNPKGWPVKEFSEVFHDTTSGNEKLQSKQFLASGVLPIIDQGQLQVAGFTDDESLAYKGDLPVIVFGDHTRIFKFVDHPFVLGADGIRVLTANPSVNPLFAYWHCILLKISSAGYSRHFKHLKEKTFISPNGDLQDSFAKVAQAVTAQVSVLGETAKKVEKLFTVMVDKAFSNRLTAKWRETHMKELLAEMEQQAKLINLPTPKELEALP